MGRTKMVQGETLKEPTKRRSKPAMSPEGVENQNIRLAYDLVEKRLREGTATSQETTHFLRIGSPTAKLEQDILRLKKAKLEAEIEAIKSQRRTEELYADAILAMKSYGMLPDDVEIEP